MNIEDDLYSKGVGIKVGHDGRKVWVTFTCQDDYAAMLLFDKIMDASEEGCALYFRAKPDK